MVAMAISLLITLAAIAALVVARRGFDSVDSSSQLRDNMRFSVDRLQRLGSQTGYKDVLYLPSSPTATPTTLTASVGGFNDALFQSVATIDTVNKVDDKGINGSDILILRMQGTVDGSVLDCRGAQVPAPTGLEDRSISVIYVGSSSTSGEPQLMCATLGSNPQPLIDGVENFQVLYGFDSDIDSVPDRFFNAQQLGTDQNQWRRVRSLRIGMVLRGALNSDLEKSAQTMYPFGKARASAGGDVGSALSSAIDKGTKFEAPADGRLRQVLTFTVHLRNDQTF